MIKKSHERFYEANILDVTLEHNGYHDGGPGHGGYVKLKIKDEGGTCMYLNNKECDEFELMFCGDSERRTFIDAFKMIVKELESDD